MKKIYLFFLILFSPALMVAQKAPLTANITINGTSYDTIQGCLYADIKLNGNPSGGNGAYSHNWTVDTGPLPFPASGSQFTTYTGLSAGVYKIFYTVQDGIGATAIDSIVVVVNSLPDISVDNDTTICKGSSIDLTCQTSTGDALVWYKGSGGLPLGSCEACAFLTVTDSPTDSTVYTAQSFITEPAGCSRTARVIVRVSDVQATAMANPNPICLGDTTQLSVNVTGGDAPFSYAWSPEDSISDITIQNPEAWPDTITTYTVTVTDKNGCTAIASVTINVPLPPTIVPADTTICFNTCTNLTANGSGTEPLTFEWNTTETSTSIYVCPIATTPYTVTMTDGNGCTSSAEATVNVNPIVIASAGVDDIICNGFSTVIGGSPVGGGGTPPYTYLWDPATGLSSATDENPTASPVVSTTYIVTVTDFLGCTATDDVFIYVHPKPNADAGKDTTICKGKCVDIGGNPTGSGTVETYNYQWGPSDGLNNSGTSNPTACPLVTTTYVVTVTDGRGCTNTDDIAITIRPLPIPTITGQDNVCLGATSNVYTTEPGMTNYIWLVTGGTITAGGSTTDNSITITWTGTGLQNVSVVYTDPNACEPAIPTVYNVTVNPLPTPTITGPTPVCLNSTGNVYSTEPDMTNYTWLVSAGGEITAGGGTTDNTVTITWNTEGPQTISVNYTDVNGCIAEVPTVYNVTVNPLPTPTITGPTPVCLNSTGNVYSTEPGMTNYTWFVIGGTITSGGTINDNTVTVTWTATGDQTVSVNYAMAGCSAAVPTVYNVTVNPLPTPTITGQTPVCLNSTGNVYSTEPGMANYTWSVTGGTITSGGTVNDNTVTVTWTATGDQTVSVNYVMAGCAAAVATVYNVKVNPLPAPTITGPTPVCFNSTGNVYTTESGMTNYTWSVTGGTITSGGTSTDNTVTVTWTATGNQTVSVNYAMDGCTATVPTIYNVTVNQLPVPTITGPTTVCNNSTGNIYTTESGMTNYIWSVIGGTITAGNGTNSITVTWDIAGIKSVSVNYTDLNGCTAAASTVSTVTVKPLPLPIISGPAPVCLNSTGNVYTTEPGMTDYTWLVSAGGTITAGGGINDNTITVTWNSAGVQSVSVNYTATNGCASTEPSVMNVLVRSLPVPTISGTASVCLNSTGNEYTTEAGMTNYTWFISSGGTITSGGGTTNNTATVTWTTAGPQTISVRYTDPNGCTAAELTVFYVTVKPLPVPIITGPSPVCAGSTGNVYLTEFGMTNYSWSVVGGTITAGGGTTSNAATVTWNTSGVQAISVSYTAVNGCTAVAPTVYNVTVKPLPLPTISGATPVCAGSTENVYTTESGMTNYIWSVSAGGTLTSGGATDNTATVTWNTAGPQTVGVSYTAANGCAAAAPAICNVTVNPLPTIRLTSSEADNVFCAGTNVTFTATGGSTYTFYEGVYPTGTVLYGPSGIDTLSTNAITFSNSIYVIGSNGTCSDTSNTIVNTVNPLPQVTIAITNPISSCGAADGEMTANVTGGAPGIPGYQWSTIPLQTSNPAINLSAGYYTVTVTDANGCTNKRSAAIGDPTTPGQLIELTGSPATICNGESVTFTAMPTNITVSNYTFYLNGGIVQGPDPSNIFTTNSLNNNDEVVVIASELTTNCSIISNIAITTVTQPPTQYLIVGGGTICSGDSVSIGLNGSQTGVDYELLFNGNPLNPQVIVHGANASISFGYFKQAGTYTVQAKSTTQNCTSIFTENVTINENLKPQKYNVTGGGTFCSGGTGVSVGLSGSETGIIYQLWYNNGSVMAAGATLSGIGTSLDFGLQTNTGYYSVIATNTSTGCSDKMIDSAYVLKNALPTAYNVTGGGAYCSGGAGVIIGLDGSQTGALYQLKFNGVNTGSPVAGTGSSISFGSQTAAGTYTVDAVIEATLCSASMNGSASVGVNSVNGSITSSADIVCKGGAVTLTATGGGSYVWNTSPSDTGPVISVNPQTTTTYFVTVTVGECSEIYSKSIVVEPAPVFSLDVDNTTSCASCDGKITVVDDQAVVISSYLWSNGNAEMINSELCPATYTVTVTSANGCSASSSAIVSKGESVTPLGIINTFTPNGDGQNEVWEIANIDLYPENKLTIINRWGNEVYSVEGYKNDWDGSNLPTGTYFYHLKVTMCEEQMTFKGYITIVR